MKFFARHFYLVAPLFLPLSSIHASESSWTYEGNHGATHWGQLGSELCIQGAQQSPINVDIKKIRPLNSSASDLKVNYGKAPLKLVNNGHTIQANVAYGETVTFKESEYRLVQFHFHAPSEHQINGRSYPMEIHLVNQLEDGRLLVIGLMVKEGKKNSVLAALWEQLPDAKGKGAILNDEATPDLASLIPANSHHVFYKGSLTTPPCTEGVQWILFERPIELSRAQIHNFRQLFAENHRPLQSVNGREVGED